MHHIYTYVYTAKPDVCSGRRISCKPNTGALLGTSIHKQDDSNSPNYCALLGTRSNRDSDSKRIGASMDIVALPLAVTIVTFIAQVVIHVTMIATMELIINIRIKTVNLVRVLVTATVIEIVVVLTVIMIYSNTNSTSSSNSIKAKTSKRNEGSDSSVSSINSSSHANSKNL